MKILCLITYFYTLLIHVFGTNELPITESIACPVNFCNGTLPSRNAVKEFCHGEINNSHMIGRCCVKNDTVIIGLDLSSCNLKSLNISNDNFTELVILDVRDNELESVVPQDLMGLLKLNYLYLPYWIPCPGGKEAWNDTHLNETYCYFQKDPCVYLNISCTDNGDCVHRGPALAKCVCKPGHYGYKCMNEEEFPVTTFSVTITVTTIILSVVLWFAHGRDAYKKR